MVVGNGSTSPTSGCGLEVKVIDVNSLHCVVEEIAPIHRLVILTSQNNECFFPPICYKSCILYILIA